MYHAGGGWAAEIWAPDAANVNAAMEVGDSGDVPGVTRQGARAEVACVLVEMSDEGFNSLQGTPSSGGLVRCEGLNRSTPGTHPLDSGSTPIQTLLTSSSIIVVVMTR